MTAELVWSLADTHCVWCLSPLMDDETCVLQREPPEAVAAGLRATVEAQAAVIARYRDGWRPDATGPDGNPLWTKVVTALDGERSIALNQLSDGELYVWQAGEVVRTEDTA